MIAHQTILTISLKRLVQNQQRIIQGTINLLKEGISINMETKLVRFVNESEFIETEIDMSEFVPEKVFDTEVFGWYQDVVYISIKK
jgi:hypothetical protein